MCHLVGVLAVATVLKVVVENRLNIEKIQHLEKEAEETMVAHPLIFLKWKVEISVVEKESAYAPLLPSLEQREKFEAVLRSLVWSYEPSEAFVSNTRSHLASDFLAVKWKSGMCVLNKGTLPALTPLTPFAFYNQAHWGRIAVITGRAKLFEATG